MDLKIDKTSLKKKSKIPHKIAVIYGGRSGEKAICELEGKLMVRFLKKYGHVVYPIKIDKTNSFFKQLAKSPKFAILCLTEDLGIQWILDSYGIKYNGSGPFATTLSLDKSIVKQIAKNIGMDTPDFYEISKEKNLDDLKSRLKFPLVVKPSRSGSSHGLSLVKSFSEIPQALEKAFKDDDHVLLEQFIVGIEVTVVCLGKKILGVVEIDKNGKQIYNYETKLYGNVTCHEPARISKRAFKTIYNIIPKLVYALSLKNLYRMDAIVKDNHVFFLEINTLPFLAEGGEPFEAVRNKGLNMYEFIEEVVKDALKYKNIRASE